MGSIWTYLHKQYQHSKTISKLLWSDTFDHQTETKSNPLRHPPPHMTHMLHYFQLDGIGIPFYLFGRLNVGP